MLPTVRFRTADGAEGASGTKLGAPYKVLAARFGEHAIVAQARDGAIAPAPAASVRQTPEPTQSPAARRTPAQGRALAEIERRRARGLPPIAAPPGATDAAPVPLRPPVNRVGHWASSAGARSAHRA